MNVIFLIPAKYELEEAIDYYNSQSEGLGFEFAAEVRRVLERILEYPRAWATISPGPAAAEQTGFRMVLFIKKGLIVF